MRGPAARINRPVDRELKRAIVRYPKLKPREPLDWCHVLALRAMVESKHSGLAIGAQTLRSRGESLTRLPVWFPFLNVSIRRA